MARSACRALKLATDAALRRACKAMRMSACVPFHSVCTMTLKRSASMRAHLAAVRQLPLFASFEYGVTMQTTGLASEPIGRLYEGGDLAAALREARARTLALYGHLDLESVRFPLLPIVNPALWELSHIAWFQEYWCSRYSPAERAAV